MIEPDKCERRKEVDAQERSYKVNDIGNMRLMLGMRMGIFKTRKATIGETCAEQLAWGRKPTVPEENKARINGDKCRYQKTKNSPKESIEKG